MITTLVVNDKGFQINLQGETDLEKKLIRVVVDPKSQTGYIRGKEIKGILTASPSVVMTKGGTLRSESDKATMALYVKFEEEDNE